MKKSKVYSFDLFETIVNRLVPHPNVIFKLMIQEAKNKNIVVPEDFYENRVVAECCASKACKDYNILDIYSYIDVEAEKKEELIELEFETEIKYAAVNKEILEIMDRLYSSENDVYIISDTYWPTSYLVRYLDFLGVSCYKDIFSSCDCRAVKYDGTLFKYVIKTIGISPHHLCHIGDNWKSDFIVPKLLGIHSKKWNVKRQYKYYYLNTKDDTKDTVFSNDKFIFCMCDRNKSRAYQMGYCIFGPVLYEFTKWVELKKNEEGKKLFFLSRDGLIMKRAYETLCDDSSSTYFYASRKALLIPTLHYCNTYDEVRKLFFQSGRETNKEILEKLGVDIDKNIGIISKYCDLDENLSSNFNELYEIFKDEINNNSIEQEKFLKDYIAHEELCDDSMIIDIGWFGNMQYSLEKVLNNNSCRIKGLYLGLVPYSERVVANQINAEGFLFDYEDDRFYQVIKSLSPFLEFFFTAEHGSVSGYKYENGIKPILECEELTGDDRYIHYEMQEGAIRYIEDRKKYVFLDNIKISKDGSISNLYRFVNHPQLDDIQLIKNITISKSGNDVRKMVNTQSALYYLFHFKRFKNDFKNSGIKTGFLKQVFKVDLAYYEAYLLIRRILGKGKT